MKANLPIKEIETIDKIKSLFLQKGQLRNYLLFVLSINTGIKLEKLLDLKVRDVKGKQKIVVGKNRSVPLTKALQKIILDITVDNKPNDYLFHNKSNARLDRTSVFYIFKTICAEIGVQDKYSVASWRKTFAYHYYKKYKDLSYLMWLFNQNSIDKTLKFINIDENMNLRFREGVAL